MFFLIVGYLRRALAFRSVRAGVVAFSFGVAFWVLGMTALSSVSLVLCAISFFFRIFVLQARLDEADKLLEQFEHASLAEPNHVAPSTRG